MACMGLEGSSSKAVDMFLLVNTVTKRSDAPLFGQPAVMQFDGK